MAKPSPLTSRAADFPRWYQDVIALAELAENGPVRGTMVIRPYGYAIWERMQADVDARIKATGVANAYFPLFIPESYLSKEAEHVEGFSPELAVVTHGGGKELEEPVVVRPTSETIINSYFAKWVQSYRDLPLLLNQWANVVRWELRPRLFLRTTEFLWQEGHTCHATQAEAQAFALRILDDVYQGFMQDVLAMPVLTGRKTERERFAGADASYTCEAMMGDGKALQMGTSHDLGQNFAKVFGTMFSTAEEGQQEYVWQTSWGVSTRMVGGLIMAHGDDAGLRLPPAVAPIQVVVMLVRDEAGAGDAAGTLAGDLRRAGLRVRLDTRTDLSFGRRAVQGHVLVDRADRVGLVQEQERGRRRTGRRIGLGHIDRADQRHRLAVDLHGHHQAVMAWCAGRHLLVGGIGPRRIHRPALGGVRALVRQEPFVELGARIKRGPYRMIRTGHDRVPHLGEIAFQNTHHLNVVVHRVRIIGAGDHPDRDIL